MTFFSHILLLLQHRLWLLKRCYFFSLILFIFFVIKTIKDYKTILCKWAKVLMNDNHIQKGKIFIASMDLCTVQLDTSFCSMALFIWRKRHLTQCKRCTLLNPCQDYSVYFLKLKIEYTVNIMLYGILQKKSFLKKVYSLIRSSQFPHAIHCISINVTPNQLI